MRLLLFLSLFIFIIPCSFSQNPHIIYDDSENFECYNRLCANLGGDSVRYCNGQKCVGQVQDFYSNGQLKHKGYYDQGKIASVFTNFYSNGTIERTFQAKSETRGSLTEYFPGGNIKSTGEYINGKMLKWEDYYENGKLEFAEEYNRGVDFHLYTHIYYEDGSPKIMFDIFDKKNRLYIYSEFYPNGKTEQTGNKIQNKSTGDYQQDGIWKYYSESGKLILEEEYIRGMLNSEKKYE